MGVPTFERKRDLGFVLRRSSAESKFEVVRRIDVRNFKFAEGVGGAHDLKAAVDVDARGLDRRQDEGDVRAEAGKQVAEGFEARESCWDLSPTVGNADDGAEKWRQATVEAPGRAVASA